MFSQFQTDPSVEQGGVIIDYGDFRVRIARAGGANKKYAKVLEAKTKIYRRAIETDTMNPDRAIDILREVFAESVVLGWETLIDGEWRQGIEGPNKDLLPFNPANVLATFRMLPDLFLDLQSQAQKVALFRADVQAIAAGN